MNIPIAQFSEPVLVQFYWLCRATIERRTLRLQYREMLGVGNVNPLKRTLKLKSSDWKQEGSQFNVNLMRMGTHLWLSVIRMLDLQAILSQVSLSELHASKAMELHARLSHDLDKKLLGFAMDRNVLSPSTQNLRMIAASTHGF
tara:strand:- start:130 stop:561 length:432 start_codon:yes stop_codon:yes gene_type:complete